jgi:hypothetical protein
MSHGRRRRREPPDYAAYLLRLWRETGGRQAQWRASLQNPHTGERVGFSSLQELFAFLEEETGSGLPGSESGRGQERESGGAR